MTDNFDFTLWNDAEKAVRIEKLRHSDPITITGNEITYSEDLRQYRMNAMEYGKTLRGIYINEDTGKSIFLNRGKKHGGITEILHHDYKDVEHLQSIAAIPQIIENSIYITTIENEDAAKNPDVALYDYYVVGLKIGETDYTVKAVVANHINGFQYYDHKLTRIEKGKLLALTAGITSPPSNQEVSQFEYKDKRLFSILQIKMLKSIGSVEISYARGQLLMLGEPIEFYGIADKQGKKRNIKIQWDFDINKLIISEIKT